MATTISDLPVDLLEEIFSRIPLTSLQSVRSTCKDWNKLCQTSIVGKEAAANQFIGFTVKNYGVCSFTCDLRGIYRNDNDDEFPDEDDDQDFVDVSIKKITALKRREVSYVYHCDGIVLCVLEDQKTLLIWNPYLGQQRSILTKFCNGIDEFALGYDNKGHYKILKIDGKHLSYAIYEFDSKSWKDSEVNKNDWSQHFKKCVSLKGNAYFYVNGHATGPSGHASGHATTEGGKQVMKDFLVCFDFTTESFGQPLYMPFQAFYWDVALSYVRNEKLAVLRMRESCMEVWITKKIDFNEILWTNYMKVDLDSPHLSWSYLDWSFIIVDEREKKGAAVFDPRGKRGYVIEITEDEHSKHKICRKAQRSWLPSPRWFCSSYVGSLLKID